MSRLYYLNIFIYCVVSWQPILATSHGNNELVSSVPHTHQELTPLGHLGAMGYVNLYYPNRVEIISPGFPRHFGFMINSYFVVTRSEYVPYSTFRIKMTGENWSRESAEVETFRDDLSEAAVIKIVNPLPFVKLEHRALQKRGYSHEALLYALDTVLDWIRYNRYVVKVMGTEWKEAAAEPLFLQRVQERRNRSHPRVIPNLAPYGNTGLVEIEEPTRVEIITDERDPMPGFAINEWFVVTRPAYVKNDFHIRLTVGRQSKIFKKRSIVRNLQEYVAVIELQREISLSKPEHLAFYYHDYSKEAVDFAVHIVTKKITECGIPVHVMGRRRQTDAGPSRLTSG